MEARDGEAKMADGRWQMADGSGNGPRDNGRRNGKEITRRWRCAAEKLVCAAVVCARRVATEAHLAV